MNVVFLNSAERDLLELKDCVLKNFGKIAWRAAYKKIKDAAARLKKFPLEGQVPDELECHPVPASHGGHESHHLPSARAIAL